MTLRLVTGKANTGKTGVVVGEVRDALAAGYDPVVVVPSMPDADRLLGELAHTHPLGVRATTFERYVEDAWAQRGDGRRLITPSQRALLATSAARSVGAGPALGRLAATCAEALTDQVGESWRQRAAPSSGPGATLGSILAAYGRSLTTLGLIESAEAAHDLAGRAAIVGDPLIVHGFTDFTHAQETLVTAAAGKAQVIVTLTWSPGFAPTASLDALVGRLAPDQVAQMAAEPFHTDEVLREVAERLFETPVSLDAGDAVGFLTAQGAEAEATGIARELRARQDLPASSSSSRGRATTAVVFRDPERHYPFVREAFDAAGIDADYDVRLPFAAVPFGAAVSSLLRFAASGDRDALTALLRSPFSGVGREDARKIEEGWRRSGVTDARRLERELTEGAPGLGSVVSSALGCAKRPLDAISAGRLAEAVGRLFVLGYDRQGLPIGGDSESDAWALSSAQRLLSDLAELGGAALTVADARDALTQQTVGAREVDQPGHVQVTAVDRVRGRRFETVIIGGLTADEFPASPAETMLPGSAVDAVLRCFGGSGEERLGSEYERMLFYAAATRARERLVLSACETDSDGEATRISPLFEAVADFFRPAEEDAPLPAHALEPIARVPDARHATGPREKARAAAYAGETSVARAAAAAARLRPRSAHLTEDALLEALAGREVFSASEIEAYLACPYRWFFDRRLHPGRLESEFDLSGQGTFAHELLALTYAELQGSGIARVSAATLPAAYEALDRAYQAETERAGSAVGVVEEVGRRAAKGWASRILTDDAEMFDDFAPTHLEWGFGYGEAGPVDMGGWSLHGFIDRIDTDSAGRAVVTDYKRSGGPKADDIVSKRKVQVPLYLEAVHRALGLEPVAGLYRCLRSRGDRGLVLAEAGITGKFTRTDLKAAEEFSAIMREALALADAAVESMRAGEIRCDPIDGACRFCSAQLVCGCSR